MAIGTPTYRLPLLAVRDIARSKAFYAELFGQTVTMDFGENVTLSGGFSLQQSFAELAGLSETSVTERAHNMELYFETEDFDGFLETLRKHPEVVLVHPPKEHPWRQRVVRLYDPDFHILEVGEAMESVVCRCLDEGMSEAETARVTQHPLEFLRHSVMHRACRKAEDYWAEREKEAVKLPREALLSQMEAFLTTHNTCALACGAGEFVRCTPIEYHYENGTFYLFSEGGRKFHALAENSNVCLGIYEPFTGFASLAGMQISGRAELVPLWSPEYLAQLAAKRLSADNLKKHGNALYLLKIRPTRMDYLWSGFQALGVDSRQFLEFPSLSPRK